MRQLYRDGYLIGKTLDYGCGHGYDAYLYKMDLYDPFYFPLMPEGPYDTITCNYVLNVIESPVERRFVISDIQSLLAENGNAFITVRNDVKNLKGYTKKKTWQGHVSLPENLIVYINSNFITYNIKKMTTIKLGDISINFKVL